MSTTLLPLENSSKMPTKPIDFTRPGDAKRVFMHLRQHLEELADFPLEDFAIEPLPSITNAVYRIYPTSAQANTPAYVLRLSKIKMQNRLNRQNESHNEGLAQSWGLCKKPIYNNALGVRLSQHHPQYPQARVHDLSNPLWRTILAQQLKKLHQQPAVFHGVLDLSKQIHAYLQDAGPGQRERLQGQGENLIQQWLILEERSQQLAIHATNLHGDLTLGNILLNHQQQHLLLIDWEYSTLGNPLWDLAILTNAAQWQEADLADFLRIYSAQTSPAWLNLLLDYGVFEKAMAKFWLEIYG